MENRFLYVNKVIVVYFHCSEVSVSFLSYLSYIDNL